LQWETKVAFLQREYTTGENLRFLQIYSAGLGARLKQVFRIPLPQQPIMGSTDTGSAGTTPG
jgi:hypothetical protein